jgi:hypothetical protein
LADLVARLLLVDDVEAPLAQHDEAVALARLRRLDRMPDLHYRRPIPVVSRAACPAAKARTIPGGAGLRQLRPPIAPAREGRSEASVASVVARTHTRRADCGRDRLAVIASGAKRSRFVGQRGGAGWLRRRALLAMTGRCVRKRPRRAGRTISLLTRRPANPICSRWAPSSGDEPYPSQPDIETRRRFVYESGAVYA